VDGDDSGFLARWSRRKALARQGHKPDGADSTDPAVPIAPPAMVKALAARAEPVAPTGATEQPLPQPAEVVEPPLTLADVSRLTRESDFTRFVAPGVNSDVKNAALKKLFDDPHFNVMDGLDTYIDDYNKADPLPAGVALQMMQSRFLGLLEPDPEPIVQSAVAAMSNMPDPESVRCGESPTPLPNENADLRLQSHDAAGRPGPEPGAAADDARQT
jgi:Protein of unknown function (DUF3306)